MTPDPAASCESSPDELAEEVARLRKINKVLMDRVERGMDLTGGAYSLFQAATVLEQKVLERTGALEAAKESMERANQDLVAAKEAAEGALRTKDEFLASMSHELRTPLNAILGAAESLIEGIQGPVSDAQEQSLRIVETSGRHLLALINDVLDVARVGAGELALHLEPVFGQAVARASLNIVSGAAHKQGVSLTLVDSGEDPCTLMADERRLKQILVNLLGNAIKFTEPGGSVRLEIVSDPVGEVVRFIVSDSGVGIAAEDLDKLFKPFVQVDSTLSRRFEGSGLGLSLVASMTELHGGSVSVQSELAEGSTFTVSLPMLIEVGDNTPSERVPTAEAPQQAAEAVASSGSGHTVLLVEDNQANVDVIAPYLEAKGYEVLIAMGGALSIEMAREHQPSVILMDIQMPGINGLEAIQCIREEETDRRTPIVALTALAMPGDRERCLEAGADDHITKPVRLRHLGETVASLLADC